MPGDQDRQQEDRAVDDAARARPGSTNSARKKPSTHLGATPRTTAKSAVLPGPSRKSWSPRQLGEVLQPRRTPTAPRPAPTGCRAPTSPAGWRSAAPSARGRRRAPARACSGASAQRRRRAPPRANEIIGRLLQIGQPPGLVAGLPHDLVDLRRRGVERVGRVALADHRLVEAQLDDRRRSARPRAPCTSCAGTARCPPSPSSSGIPASSRSRRRSTSLRIGGCARLRVLELRVVGLEPLHERERGDLAVLRDVLRDRRR